MSRIEDALAKAARIREAESPDTISPMSFDSDVASEETSWAPLSPYVVTMTAPDSPAAEEYRKLKAMVIKMTKQESSRNSIMVTSCTSSEGKSLLSINLAVSLAQEVGLRALLIDADLRRPSVASYLGIDASTGLVDCLRDGASPSSVIRRTSVPKLDLLPAGQGVRNPVELLSSPKMRSIAEDLRRSYPDRYIIIDTPPILPFAESQIISLLAGGVLLVVREGAVTAAEISEAVNILQGTRILGFVFNDVTGQSMSGRYRHYYRYYAEREQERV